MGLEGRALRSICGMFDGPVHVFHLTVVAWLPAPTIGSIESDGSKALLCSSTSVANPLII